MAEVSELRIYPISGCSGVSVDSALVTPSGLEHDRRFVLHDGAGKRVSIKQYPKLTQVRTGINHLGIHLTHDDQPETVVPYSDYDGPDVVAIDEFGDATPCVDTGEDTAAFFSNLLRTDVRLVEKIKSWRDGQGIPPKDRQNAAVHIVNIESVGALRQYDPNSLFDSDRFRGAVMISGQSAFSERQWLGKTLRAGYASFGITRETPRCPVPGFDPETGENLKDVPRLYSQLARQYGERGKRVFGVYGHPYILGSALRSVISVGDTVEIV